MEYKVGDKVRVRKDLNSASNTGAYSFSEKMNKYKGKQAIIKQVLSDNYSLDIDNCRFFWTDEMLKTITESIDQSDENKDEVSTNLVESVVENGQNTEKSTVKNGLFSKEDLKFGDIVTLRNGIQGLITIEEVQYNDDTFNSRNDFNDDFTHKSNNKNLDIMKVQRYIHYSQYGNTIYTLVTLYERKEEILDEIEKKFLNDIIYPYKNRVKCIIKKEASAYPEYSYLRIDVKSICEDRGEEKMLLPYFETSKMYKGMENGEPYTLEELGL